MNQIINIGRTISVTFVMLTMLVLPAASVQAADASYDYGGWETTSYTDYSEPSYDYGGWETTSYTDYSYPSDDSHDYGGWETTSYTDYYYPSYPTYSYGGGGGGGGGHYTYNYPKPKPAPTCVITVSPGSITQGQAVIVSWTSSNATSGSITNLGSVAMIGSQTLYPNTSTTYTGTFSGAGGTVSCSGSVGVLPQAPAAPSCVLTLSKTYMNYGYQYQNQGITLSWSSSNASYGVINQGIGNVSPSGSRVVYPYTTTTYTGTFYGANGQTTICSATITVATVPPPIHPPVYPTTPYVTLAAVPYTGLDLGPVGTAFYWAFLVAWCLLAAYLIAIKRVHMQIYRWYSKVLFGSTALTTSGSTAVTAHSASAEPKTFAQQHSAPAAATNDAVDPFIFAQINRNRR